MPLIQRLSAERRLVELVSEGDAVRCGPVGAVWRVMKREDDGDDGDVVLFTLAPVDPHDVPLDARVVELPMPRREPGA